MAVLRESRSCVLVVDLFPVFIITLDQLFSKMPQESTIDLGDLTDKNVGQLKILNAAIFPVKYNDKFYSDLLLAGREELTKLGMLLITIVIFKKIKQNNLFFSAYYNDVLVGAVCCRIEDEHKLYIMTLGVLAPYRQLKIGMLFLY